jgi:hypothetical protein
VPNIRRWHWSLTTQGKYHALDCVQSLRYISSLRRSLYLLSRNCCEFKSFLLREGSTAYNNF